MTGYGKMVAILLYYIIFTTVPAILNYVILAMNPYFSPETQYLIIIVSTVTAITLLFNGAMYFIYTRKIEFFEQYRVNRDVILLSMIETLALVVGPLEMARATLEKYKNYSILYLGCHSYSAPNQHQDSI